MPEGPEIRRAADMLASALSGHELVHVEYRVPGLARRGASLAGRHVRRAYARGKALLVDFDGELTHYSHNQLYGRWQVTAGCDTQDESRTVRVVLATARHTATLYAATQIALLPTTGIERHPYLAGLGPDALDVATTQAMVRARLTHARFAGRSLGSLLLDQGFVAGLGNYLRSDILFVAGVHADLRPRDLSAKQLGVLARAILSLPRRSYRTGGITNDAPRVRAARREGVAREDYRFQVYGREKLPCWVCGTRITRTDRGGRGVYECVACQRR